MMHDTADTESESEALQEDATATVAEGAGFGAENDVASRYVLRSGRASTNAASASASARHLRVSASTTYVLSQPAQIQHLHQHQLGIQG